MLAACRRTSATRSGQAGDALSPGRPRQRPWTWNTDLAVSSPIITADMATPPLVILAADARSQHRSRVGAVHAIKDLGTRPGELRRRTHGGVGGRTAVMRQQDAMGTPALEPPVRLREHDRAGRAP